MAVLQMQRVSICALKKDRKSILEKLQSMGVMEVSQVLEDESGFEKQNTQGTRILFEKKSSSEKQMAIFYVRKKANPDFLFSGVYGRIKELQEDLECLFSDPGAKIGK